VCRDGRDDHERFWFWAVTITPAAVSAFDDDVDLLPEILTDVGTLELAGVGVKGEAPWIPKTEGVDLVPDGLLVEEGIVHEDGLGQGAEPIVHVDAEDFAVQHPRILSESERIVAEAAVSEGDVEVSLGAKGDVPAPVVGEGLGDFQKDALGIRDGHGLAASGASHLADDGAAGFVLGVAEIEEPVLGESRIKSDAVHAFFKKDAALHFVSKVEKGPTSKTVVQPHGAKFTALHSDDLFPAFVWHSGEHDGGIELAVKR
jgi:hypothetical protein